LGGYSRSSDSGCCCQRGPQNPELLICILDGDEYDAVALGVHLSELVLHLVGGGLVFHRHDGCAGALPFEVHHHWCATQKALLGAHVLVAHLHP
jgi:hypothetical protein